MLAILALMLKCWVPQEQGFAVLHKIAGMILTMIESESELQLIYKVFYNVLVWEIEVIFRLQFGIMN